KIADAKYIVCLCVDCTEAEGADVEVKTNVPLFNIISRVSDCWCCNTVSFYINVGVTRANSETNIVECTFVTQSAFIGSAQCVFDIIQVEACCVCRSVVNIWCVRQTELETRPVWRQ